MVGNIIVYATSGIYYGDIKTREEKILRDFAESAEKLTKKIRNKKYRHKRKILRIFKSFSKNAQELIELQDSNFKHEMKKIREKLKFHFIYKNEEEMTKEFTGGFSTRTKKIFYPPPHYIEHGFKPFTLRTLIQCNAHNILKIKNIGRKSLKEIENALHKIGLYFNMPIEEIENYLGILEEKKS